MTARSQLLLPPQELASCIGAAILRDTRGAALDDDERMNFFPATPMVSVTRVFHGQLHLSPGLCTVEDLRASAPAPDVFLSLPSETPTVSWSPGPVTAMTIAFYTDAWAQLAGEPTCASLPVPLRGALDGLVLSAPLDRQFQHFCDALLPLWRQHRETAVFAGWPGSDKVADWARHVIGKSLAARRSRSKRSVERMLRRWTGLSRKGLEFHARIENLHRLRQRSPGASLADMAHATDFADQSHMGRVLKRATGFSPGVLNRRIDADEAFWCYRLLGERF